MKYEHCRCKIKVGQMWKKKDTGQIVIVTGNRGKEYYATRKINGSRKTHGIYAKDLWLFWELI